jgi:hypothetical protein
MFAHKSPLEDSFAGEKKSAILIAEVLAFEIMAINLKRRYVSAAPDTS